MYTAPPTPIKKILTLENCIYWYKLLTAESLENFLPEGLAFSGKLRRLTGKIFPAIKTVLSLSLCVGTLTLLAGVNVGSISTFCAGSAGGLLCPLTLTWMLGIQTLVLGLEQQVCYPLSHLPWLLHYFQQ